MPEIIDLLRSAAKIDNRLALSKQVTLVPGTANVVQPVPVVATVSIYKLTGGERGERASKANTTRADAESWIAARPENQYEIVAE